jgi:hypothetical protein
VGGLGSGNWWHPEGKTTVEESQSLAIRDFRGQLKPGEMGILAWASPGGQASLGRFEVTGQPDAMILTLHYAARGAQVVELPLRLVSTPMHFGGRWWWFGCPSAMGDGSCQLRAGKLYLPPGAIYFACRQCHDLTYRSCQEAHQMERLYRKYGLDPEVGRRTAALARRLSNL